MNQFLAIPIEFRVALLFLLGAIIASFLNLAIYRLAYQPRWISPWSPAPAGAQARTWRDRIPVLGWLRMQREAKWHGQLFWLRPMLLELITGAGLAALYWWEIDQQAILPPPTGRPAPPAAMLNPVTAVTLHGPLLAHVILFCLMIVATFIDVDEKTIPDTITVPGTLIALLVAGLNPWSLLPATVYLGVPSKLEFLQIATPTQWPAELIGGPNNFVSLAIGLACLWFWCFALLPRTWHGRYGFRRAAKYFVAKVLRDAFSWMVLGIGVIASLGIGVAWWLSGACWVAVLSSLVGMVAGAVMIWSVRLVGSALLRKEAMGFGDVTLMAMIGAFVGWQASLFVFFLAPIAGLVIGVLQLIIRRDNTIPYGPFLCLAAMVVIVWWSSVWSGLRHFFQLGLWIPLIMVVCLAAMTILLGLLQLAKLLIRRWL